MFALAVSLLLSGNATAVAQPNAVIGRSFAGSPQFSFDADGAVGPNHYGEITNLSFRVTALATGTVVYSSATLGQFWSAKVGLTLTGCCFDPQLEYDASTGRWFAVSLASASSAGSAVYLGVSSTSDPSGAWKGVIIDADPSDLRWADLSSLGTDGAGVYVTTGMPGISAATPFRKALFVLPKNDLLAAVPTLAHLSRFLTEYPTTVATDFYYDASPVKDRSAAGTEGLHLASDYQPAWSFDSGTFRWAINAVYQRMTGQAAGTATLLPWATTPWFRFDSTTNPSPSAQPTDWGRQPGTVTRLNNGGGDSTVRVGDAVYSVTSTYVRGRLGIIWRILQPSTNTIVDAGFIGDDLTDYLGTSIAANARGDVVIAYTRTSQTEYGSFYFSAGRPDAGGHLVFDSPKRVKAGTDIYDANGPVKSAGIARFIDYATSVSVLPSEPSRFWISGPYVSGRNIGSTWIAEVIMPVAAPASLTLQRYGPTGVILNWTATQGSTGYVVKRGQSPGGETVHASGITGTSAYIAGNKNTRYYFTVSALSGTVESGSSNEVAVTLTTSAGRNDLDGDGVSDLMVYRPTSGNWFSRSSTAGYAVGAGDWNIQWGANGDVPMSADFDGDGKVDPTVFRPGTGQWFILYSSLNFNAAQYGYLEWGALGDVPFTADFDGDGLADIGVFRPSNGYWYLRLSAQGWTTGAGNWIFAWGASGDVPITGDLDGDGRADIGVFRPSTGQWFFLYSSLNFNPAVFGYFEWGATGDVNLTADFDGDARGDIGVYRPSTGQWFLLLSSLGYSPSQYGYFEWGASGDVPKMGDWDGDGRADVAVYRPATGYWFIRYSSHGWDTSSGQFGVYGWGASGDTALPAR